MSAVPQRSFSHSLAVRSSVPLLIGLVAPSGGGKTKSALRLATGIQSAQGGDIYGIDSEADRMLHYADDYNFQHVPFRAPFDALSYLAAVEYCVAKGAKTIIIDSASHLHEGPGGTLEMHEAECERLMKAWNQPREKVQMSAWQRPKRELRLFLNTVLQLNVNTIWCFRAKEKLKVIPGKPPQPLGFMPIAGDEMVYEMTLNCLLYPNSGGVPFWHPEEMGERAIVKLPQQFREVFKDEVPLSEDIGAKLATWAAGASLVIPPTVGDYDSCSDQASFDEIEKRRATHWKTMPTALRSQLKTAADAAKKRIKEAPAVTNTAPQIADDDALKAATSKEDLESIWAQIKAKHDAAGTEIDLNADFAYTTRKEQLEAL
jgi:hypothetical protein